MSTNMPLHWLPLQDLEQLLRRLPPPMGLGARATESDVMRFVFRSVGEATSCCEAVLCAQCSARI